jgi:hypothetical protein
MYTEGISFCAHVHHTMPNQSQILYTSLLTNTQKIKKLAAIKQSKNIRKYTQIQLYFNDLGLIFSLFFQNLLFYVNLCATSQPVFLIFRQKKIYLCI